MLQGHRRGTEGTPSPFHRGDFVHRGHRHATAVVRPPGTPCLSTGEAAVSPLGTPPSARSGCRHVASSFCPPGTPTMEQPQPTTGDAAAIADAGDIAAAGDAAAVTYKCFCVGVVSVWHSCLFDMGIHVFSLNKQVCTLSIDVVEWCSGKSSTQVASSLRFET